MPEDPRIEQSNSESLGQLASDSIDHWCPDGLVDPV